MCIGCTIDRHWVLLLRELRDEPGTYNQDDASRKAVADARELMSQHPGYTVEDTVKHMFDEAHFGKPRFLGDQRFESLNELAALWELVLQRTLLASEDESRKATLIEKVKESRNFTENEVLLNEVDAALSVAEEKNLLIEVVMSALRIQKENPDMSPAQVMNAALAEWDI